MDLTKFAFARLQDGENAEAYCARAITDPALIAAESDQDKRAVAVVREAARLFGGTARLTTPVMVRRTFEVRAADIDEAARTVKVLMATETPVLRSPYWGDPFFEILRCRPENADISFFKSGRAPLCVDHNLGNHIGVIQDADLTASFELRGAVRFSKANPRGVQEFEDVKDGIRVAVSIGYMIEDGQFHLATYEGVPDTLEVTKWRAMELSTCAIGLDPLAGVGRSGEDDAVSFPKALLEGLRAKAVAARDEAVRSVSTEITIKVTESDPAAAAVPGPTATTAGVEGNAEALKESTPEGAAAVTSVDTSEESGGASAENPVQPIVAENEPNRSTPVEQPAVETAKAAKVEVTMDAALKEALEGERARTAQLNAMGKKYKCEDDASAAIQSGLSVNEFARQCLDKLEARQKPTGKIEVDMTEKEVSQYSLANAIRSAGLGTWGRENSLELEVHRDLERQGMKASANGSILIPHTLLGQRARAAAQRHFEQLSQRAPSLESTGTGVHLVPQIHGQFHPFLVSQLALVRAGVTVLTGIRGEVDFPGGQALGAAVTPGENASVSDAEATFRNFRATPKQVRSRASFSRTLLNNSVPSVDAVIEQVLQTRARIKLESQMFIGNGMSGEIKGIDNTSGVGDGDLAGNALTYPTALNLITVIDNAKGLIGPASIVTSMGTINKGLTTARFGTGSDRGVFNYLQGQTDVWALDGVPIYRSHEVKTTYASPASPSQLIAHGGYAGVWDWTYLVLFGPGMELLVDPFTAAATGVVTTWVNMDVDYAIPMPEVLSRFDNLLL